MKPFDPSMAKVYYKRMKKLAELLTEAKGHLDWIGWGDSYERECSGDLDVQIERVLESLP